MDPLAVGNFYPRKETQDIVRRQDYQNQFELD
jgi:hypothetical protein